MTDGADGAPEDPAPRLARLVQRLRSTVERMAPAVPFLGGFGFGAVVVLSLLWSGWASDFWTALPFGALFTGIVYRHNRLPAYLGFAAAGTVFWLLYLALHPYQCRGEYCGLTDVIVPVAYIALLVLAAGAIALPGFLAPGTLPFDRWLRNAAAVVGVVVVSLGALTTVLLAANLSPVSLPPGWHVLTYPPYSQRDPAFGEDYTAVRNSATAVPSEYYPPTEPVLGVTVVRTWVRMSAAACRSQAAGFATASPLYLAPFGPSGPPGSSGEVALAGVPAYEEVQLPIDGSRLYSWSLSRSRMIGVLPLELCYILVVWVPPDSAMTERDATAIVSAIRIP